MFKIILSGIIVILVSNYWFQWENISFSDHLIIIALCGGFLGVIEAIEKIGKKKGE